MQYVRCTSRTFLEGGALPASDSVGHSGPQFSTEQRLTGHCCLVLSEVHQGCSKVRACTMNADPSVVALSSELDRGATGHEPGRGAIAGVQCLACNALSGVPCISVQTPKVCSELCGRAYAIRARGVCSVGVRGVTFQRGRSGMVAFASAMSASAGVAGGIVPRSK